jgi:hypothetical protein
MMVANKDEKRNVFSTLKMEAAGFSKTLVTFHKTTWRDNFSEALFQFLLYRQACSVFEYEWENKSFGMEMIELS